MSERNSCPKCGRELDPSDVEGYRFVCHHCDENFYGFEAVESVGARKNPQPCDTCPKCGEYERVEYGRVYAENGWAWHEVECLECGFRYRLEYEFKVVDWEEA